ncbi:restriction endonuclease subunit S [Bacteroides bouchesdurhonensis]|uniref:restriction endonuclease subunit S n=1 Tax=Bacteroides bouchesdurhonensis TaxID=1841855 RepID=UPI0021CAF004|nr:restriction endonuclease subunit S [Bacteroides bouchesdurhonensis]
MERRSDMVAGNVKWVRLGDYIEQCDERNTAGNNYPVIGINRDKTFMPTVANLDGVDIAKYKVITKGMFVFSGMQTGRDICIRIGLYGDEQPALISPAYTTFIINDEKEVLPEYFFMYFNRAESDRYGWFISDSSVRANLDWPRFLDIEIPLPSPTEQQKVVNAWKAFWEIKEQNEAKAAPLMQICQSYIQELKHKYPLQEIGSYIEECNERNLEGKFAEQDVRGIATSKGLIETKANLDGVSLNSYKLVKSKEIAFVPDTSRRGDKMSLGLNDSDKTYIVSSISSVFKVDEENILSKFLYLWFCRPEFDRYARFNSWGSARETFTWEDMKRCKIPLPPIDVQRAIINIYKCANEAKQIAEEADRLSHEVCPALLQHVIHS